MKIPSLSVLAIGLSFLGFAACGRSHERANAPRTSSGAPAAATEPDLDGFEVQFQSAAVPARMAPGSEAKVRLEAKNVGSKAWSSAGDSPLHFGYHWEAPDAGGNWVVVATDDGNRGILRADVAPGETVVVTLPVRALPKACPNCRVWSETAKSIAPVNIS